MTALEPTPVATLTDQQITAIRTLIAQTAGAADHPPLSDRALLQLSSGAPVRHLIAEDSDTLAGYAQLEPDDGTVSVELVAQSPEIATTLLHTALTTADTPVRIWAHGEASPVNEIAEHAGLHVVRRLLQLRMTLDDASVEPIEPPAGVTIRPFVPGQDDAAWLAVNSRAFASHPEQGRWTQQDLDGRLRSDWFDPAGFLLAERDGMLLGYHWTKLHADTRDDEGRPIGEVYVLGVDPDVQGIRLGSILLRAGLRHLAEQGVHTVLLYVDEDNDAAVRLYRKLGFTTFATDVQWGASDPASNTASDPATNSASGSAG